MKAFKEETIVDNKTITRKYGYGIKVIRNRDSDGNCSITISVNSKIGSVSMIFDNDRYSDNYEQVAKAFASALDDISNEPCLLTK